MALADLEAAPLNRPWECPRCGTINAWWVARCRCKPPALPSGAPPPDALPNALRALQLLRDRDPALVARFCPICRTRDAA